LPAATLSVIFRSARVRNTKSILFGVVERRTEEIPHRDLRVWRFSVALSGAELLSLAAADGWRAHRRAWHRQEILQFIQVFGARQWMRAFLIPGA
jgi:hypothetical protein